MEPNKITPTDFETNKDTEQEILQLYEKLGQCTTDKKEIRDIVNNINNEGSEE